MTNINVTTFFLFTKAHNQCLSLCPSVYLSIYLSQGVIPKRLVPFSDYGAFALLYYRSFLWSDYPDVFWLGGNDIEDDGNWVWASTDQPISNNSWGPEEPNGGDAEKCLVMWQSANYSFADYSCDNDAGYICEISYVQ